jgi:hypothetical protein
VLEINTWYAEVEAPKINSGENHSLLGICQGFSFPLLVSLLARAVRLRLHLLLLFCAGEEDRCHKFLVFGPMWHLKAGWVVLLRAEKRRGILASWLKCCEQLE